MGSLQGKVIIVTGASTGMGRAIAVGMAAAGATLGLVARTQEKLDETASLARAKGAEVLTFPGNVADNEVAKHSVRTMLERFGRIDVLVNNAGDLVERKPLLEMTEALWRQVLDLNLSSVFFVTQAAAPGMIERGRGAIVNVSSLAAHNGGGPGALAYAAAKGGLISLTKAMAKELAPKGVRVNCVSPGLIGQTAFHGRFTAPEAFAAIEKTIPLGRGGTPEEVGRVIAFLAGPDAAYLVGETVEVNGGMFMR